MGSPLFDAGATERLNIQAEIKRKGGNGEGERMGKEGRGAPVGRGARHAT